LEFDGADDELVAVLARFLWTLAARIRMRGSEPMTATPIPLFDDLHEEPPSRRRQTRLSENPQSRATDPDHLLTAVEAAAVLGIGRSKLYELVARGAVRSVKLDRCRRFRRSDLDTYIRSLPVASA
jgi:excisionase family DNA binding protein